MDQNKFLMVLYGAGFAAAIVIPLLLLWRSRKKRREKFGGLAAALGGEAVTGMMTDDYVRLNTAAGEAKLKLIPGDDKEPPYLELQVAAPIGFAFAIRKENTASRALERWGLMKEVKIGDSLFDEQYLIWGDDQTRIFSFLQDPGRREAVDYFFRNGFRELYTSPEAVVARKFKYREEDLEPSLLRSHLEQLGRFAGKK